MVLRAFYGVVFNEETKKRIHEIQMALMKISDKGKFPPKENFHITLRFIGEIDAVKVKDYGRLLFESTKDFRKIKLLTSHVGSFSKGSTVLPWLGIRESEELVDLQKSLQDTLTKKHAFEGEAFSPHITLGRDVVLNSNLGSLKVEAFEIVVNRLALFESRTIDGKLSYIERAVVHLL